MTEEYRMNGLTIKTDVPLDEDFRGLKFINDMKVKITTTLAYRCTNGGITGGSILLDSVEVKEVDLFVYTDDEYPKENEDTFGPFEVDVEAGKCIDFDIKVTSNWSGVFDKCELTIEEV